MAETVYYLAVDIGASSGRHMVGWYEEDTVKIKEVYRFPNGVREQDGHLVWNIEQLFFHVVQGILEALREFPVLESISIDTWGVDYVLMKGEQIIAPVYAYRDHRTEPCISQVHDILPFSKLYSHTGCQFQPFNTIYQLYADKQAGRLEQATDLLMIPEYLLYRLCGGKAREYTNATTTGMVNAETGEFDREIIDALGYPQHLFPKLSKPGKILGTYQNIPCVLCATHDTASAVEGIPMEGNHPYISSGTWSLLGVKTEKPLTDQLSQQANYSNEGGVGYNRYQKNIMGMWLVNQLHDELCPEKSIMEVVTLAQESTCRLKVDASSPAFLAPSSMRKAFDEATGNQLYSAGDYFKCAYLSLAESYKIALDELEANTGCKYDHLYIVGGGAKNKFLNKLTQKVTGKRVVALPIEATALGNLKIQMEVL